MMKLKLMLGGLVAAGAVAAWSAGAQQYLTFGASGTGGTYGIIAAAVSKVVNDKIDGAQMTVEATPGGGRGNIRLLSQSKLDFGLATVSDAVDAWEGAEGYDQKSENLRTVLLGPTLPFHLVVPADSLVKSPADLKGRSIVTNSAANELRFVPDALAAYGLEEGDYQLVQYATTEAIEALKDGRAHAFASFFFMPAAPLVDLATSRSVRFIGMEPERIEKLVGSHGIYGPDEIAAGIYPGQTNAVATPSISVAIYSHDGISADTAYGLTKTIVENLPELAEIYKPAASFTAERQQAQLRRGQPVPPYHEGAERYLRETGLLK